MKEKLLDKAQKLIQKGYPDKAVIEYRAAVDLDPKDTSIRLRLGDLFVKLGKKDEAVKEYTEVARQNSQKGFYLKAIAVYKQVLKLDDTIEVHNKLAELYVKQRLIADAISEYSFIMNSFEKKGKSSEVLDIVKKMVEIDPENLGVRMKLAEMYQRFGFEKDALNEYSQIFNKYLEQGKLDRAEGVFAGLYNAAPREPIVIRGLADLYRRKSDTHQYIRYLKTLFSVYDEQGRDELAREVCAEILKAKPEDEQSLKYLKGRGTTDAPVLGVVKESRQETAPEKDGALIDLDFDLSAALPEAPIPIEPPVAQAEPAPEEAIEISLDGLEGNQVETLPITQAASSIEPGLESNAVESAGAGEIEIEFDIEGVEGASEALEDAATSAPETLVALETSEGRKPAEHEPESEPMIDIDLDGFYPAPAPATTTALEPVKAKEVVEQEAPLPESVEDEVLAAVSEIEELEAADASVSEGGGDGITETVAQEEQQPELIEKMEPDELIEPEPKAEEAAEEYVDLSAELGLDKALDDMAGAWGAEGSKDTYDEFKDGIGKQLNKEDSETHYNLGIAYMEMELYNEAMKEFKVALKDPHLESDCYTRLGLCAVARNSPEEAISYYQKGLRIPGADEEARKGMMYELALAYELAKKFEDAGNIFSSISSIDPNFREASAKAKEYSDMGCRIPMDDGLIEVEFL